MASRCGSEARERRTATERGPMRARPRRSVAALAAGLLLALAACRASGLPLDVSPLPSPAVPESRPTQPRAPLRFIAVGDVGQGDKRQAAVANAIARTARARSVDLVLVLGDLIYPHGDPREFARKFARPYRPVLEAGAEIRAVLGNHDIETDPEAILRLFRMPGRWYTFTRGDADFFALDSSTGRIGAEQRAWLEGALRRSRARWKIAFMHVPPFSSGMHGSSRPLQSALVPLFRRYDVHLALAGHDHNYERTVAIEGTTYIVSGGGCCPRRFGRSRFTAAAGTGLHFVLVEVTRQAMRIEALTAGDRVMDRARIGARSERSPPAARAS